MSEIKKQHYEKEFEFEGVTLRVRKLSPFEFPAFKTAFANSTNNNDPEGIAKSYETICGWLEQKTFGDLWVSAYDKKQGKFTVEILNEMEVANRLIDYILINIITPLFLNTAE